MLRVAYRPKRSDAESYDKGLWIHTNEQGNSKGMSLVTLDLIDL